MHKVKASDLVTLRRVLADTRPEAMGSVRAAMPEPLRGVLDASVAGTWLPDPQICEIYGYFCRVLFPGSPQPFVALGQEMARASYRGVYRVFLAIPSTSFVISRAAAVWASYHSTGAAVMEDVHPGSATLVVRGADPIERAMIDIISGHILALAELTGAKDARVVPSGDAKGGYRWAIRWR